MNEPRFKNQNEGPVFGQKNRKRRRHGLTEYGRMLREKQALKALYGLRERQFKRYVKESTAMRGKVDIANLLVQRLEKRLDNVVYRLGFAITREQARQLVSHGPFLVNGRKVTIPSYQVSAQDKIFLKTPSRDKGVFRELTERLKKHQLPTWLKAEAVGAAEVIADPNAKEVALPIQLALIFEFYSR